MGLYIHFDFAVKPRMEGRMKKAYAGQQRKRGPLARLARVLCPHAARREGANAARLCDAEIDSLLGREPVVLSSEAVRTMLRGKRVLVTGGGGSIGSELCRQIAAREPAELVILEIYENNAYDIEMELRQQYPRLNLRVLIGSVRDEKRVRGVFAATRPQQIGRAHV